MLKVTVHNSRSTTRFQLEGKLTAPWTAELEHCWRTTQSGSAIRTCRVDLTDVEYADAAGRYLLGWMHSTGVQLVASSLTMQELISDIASTPSSQNAHPKRRMSHKLAGWCLSMLAVFPVACAERPIVRLTVRRAVELAIAPEGNARIQIADEAVKQAESRSAQARAALLPNLDGYVSELSQTRNLTALGLRFNSPVPGFQIPTFVGPFSTLDIRANVTQSVFDLSSIRRFQASKASVAGVRADRENTSDQVAAQVVRAYVGVLKADADVAAAQANVDLAKAVLKQVEDQKAAGSGVGIEVTRAKVQLSNEQQRLLVVRNDRRRAALSLLRAVGLRLDTGVELDQQLSYQPAEPVTAEQAMNKALKSRSDYLAQAERERSFHLSSSATAWERLPSVTALADYGSIGTGISNALPTRTYGVQIRIPVFDGGRRDARRGESSSQYRQEKSRTRDLRDQIELEIRVALDALGSADEQVAVAREGLLLAEQELASARRRYQAGVATSVEITDAQTRLERARDNNTAALFAYNLARVDLAQAQGTIEDVIQ